MWQESGRLLVSAPVDWPDTPWREGESLAVNGVCLTLVDWDEGLRFDLSSETLARTTLGNLGPGSPVNLERAMSATDRFGGHWVQGHVDQVGSLVSLSERDDTWTFRFDAGEGANAFLVDKGSITVDGISLTVVEPEGTEFDVAVIPHTYRHTNLSRMRPGDAVNIEFDILAKYVDRMISLRLRS